MTQFIAWNSAMPTTTARAGVTTGTAIKTMLQIATPATRAFRVVRWGVRFESAPTAIARCELVVTGSVAASVTSHVAAGIQPYDRTAGTPASTALLTSNTTGFTASAEGTVTATRTADEWVAPIGVSFYDYEWSLGREFEVPPSTFLRVRITTSPALTAQCYVVWDE